MRYKFEKLLDYNMKSVKIKFDEFGLSKDKKFMCLDRSNCGDSKINIIDGQSGKRVFKIDDEDQTNLALPKMDFAEAIYTKNPVLKDILKTMPRMFERQ